MSNELATTKSQRSIDVIKSGLEQLPLHQSLPANISPEKFKNAALTAINLNPDLLQADRNSLFTACMKAAHDGLLPDGRESALVIYSTKVKRDGNESWIKAVQYLPMAYGVIKRLRNSGEISSISVHVVYQNDSFEYTLGDDESIKHKPTMDKEPGEVVASYAIVKMKDGSVQREVMPRRDIEKARAASKSKDSGPWVNWFDEMARKTVLKRISKYLPMTAEDAAFIHREDKEEYGEFVDASAPSLPAPAATSAPVASKLDQFEQDAPEPTKAPRGRPKSTEAPVVAREPSPVTIDHQPEPEPEPEPKDLPYVSPKDFMIQGFADCKTRTELIDFWRSPESQEMLGRLNGTTDLVPVQHGYATRHKELPPEEQSQGVV